MKYLRQWSCFYFFFLKLAILISKSPSRIGLSWMSGFRNFISNTTCSLHCAIWHHVYFETKFVFQVHCQITVLVLKCLNLWKSFRPYNQNIQNNQNKLYPLWSFYQYGSQNTHLIKIKPFHAKHVHTKPKVISFGIIKVTVWMTCKPYTL